MNPEKQDLQAAVEILKRGGIILYPTDTIWGIGCDATNAEAVQRIYALKKREDAKSMLVLVGSEVQLERTVGSIPDAARMLMEVADRPMTIIYDRAYGISPALLASDGSVGVRLTSETYSAQLCRLLGRPVVSTSANISGQKAPSDFVSISDDVKNGVDYIAQYRRTDTAKASPSNIIKVKDNGEITIIR